MTIAVCGFFQHAQAASFDCKKAGNNIERAICQDPEISMLDEELSKVYKIVRMKEKEVVKEQRAWLKIRNKCADSACLKRIYSERIAELVSRGALKEAEEKGAVRAEAQPQQKMFTVTEVACINNNMNVYTVYDTKTMVATTSTYIRARLGEPWKKFTQKDVRAKFYFVDTARTLAEANYPNNPKGFANRDRTNLENGKRVSFEGNAIRNEKTCVIAARK